MNQKRFLFALCAIALLLSQELIIARMQPIKKDGRYYYSSEDTHNHAGIKKLLSFLLSKMFAPEKLLKNLTSLFYSSEKQDMLDPMGLLKPIQTVPAAYSIEPQITWIGHAT